MTSDGLFKGSAHVGDDEFLQNALQGLDHGDGLHDLMIDNADYDSAVDAWQWPTSVRSSSSIRNIASFRRFRGSQRSRQGGDVEISTQPDNRTNSTKMNKQEKLFGSSGRAYRPFLRTGGLVI